MLVSYRCPRVGMNKAKNTKTPFSEVCLKKEEFTVSTVGQRNCF